MKIVITNESGFTDAHLAALREIGEVVTHTDTNNDNYAERLKDTDIAVIDCYITPITKEFLSKVPNLKFFSINSTGYDNVDVDAVRNAHIAASNVPGFSTEAVAEMAIGLMFAAVRKIAEGDREFRNGLAAVDPGTLEAQKYMGFNLYGKTLGVVGLGNIGTRVAEIGKGIGMNVIGYNRTAKNIPDVEMVPLDNLVARSDVAVICLALTAGTAGLISRDKIAKMKKASVLVSIAGMGIVDQNALIEALNSNSIAAAGIDTGNELMFKAKNTVLTPHIGYNTRESHENMGRIIVENIKAFAAGKPVNTIE